MVSLRSAWSSIMAGGYEADLKPGSMGLPAPGYDVAVIDDALAIKTTSEASASWVT